MSNASAITNYVSKMAHPLASGALFAGGHSFVETGTLSFDKELLTDFVVQAVSSYGGEMIAPAVHNLIPALPQGISQSASTAALNVLAGMASDKLMGRAGQDTGKEILYRFILSLGSEAVTGMILDGTLSFVGQQLTPPSPSVGGAGNAFRGVGSLH